MSAASLVLPQVPRSVRIVESPPAIAPAVDPARHPAAAPLAPPPDDDARLAELLADVRCALADVEQRRQQSLDELRVAALELAAAAAALLLQRAIAAGDYAVEEVVQQACESLAPRRPIAVALHPDDLRLWRERTRDPPLELPCELRPDPQLPRGDCRVELADGVALLRSVAAALTDIHHAWLEHLDDPPLERRRPADRSLPLQRFPDRRETA
jgi:hypothetical protein